MAADGPSFSQMTLQLLSRWIILFLLSVLIFLFFFSELILLPTTTHYFRPEQSIVGRLTPRHKSHHQLPPALVLQALPKTS